MAEQINIEDLSFREAMAQLDQIVNLLESNTLELEESLEKYEMGVKLLASLQKRLDGAQLKVQTLMGQLQPETPDAIQDSTLS